MEEDPVLEALNKIRDFLQDHFAGKLEWEVDYAPLVEASVFPYTLVELQDRNGLFRLFGKKHIDLMGFNGEECLFHSDGPCFHGLDQRLKTLVLDGIEDGETLISLMREAGEVRGIKDIPIYL